MVKYFITDGHRYIRRCKGRYQTCTNQFYADRFTHKQASDILQNKLCNDFKKIFYLEETETSTKVEPQKIETRRQVITEKKVIENEEMMGRINSITECICGIELPSFTELQEHMKNLNEAQSFYDRALADIDHWIMNHKPQAHIRTMVYGFQHNLEVRRAKVKENLRLTEVLLENSSKNMTFDTLKHKLNNRITTPYKPNTYIYQQLDDLLGGKHVT